MRNVQLSVRHRFVLVHRHHRLVQFLHFIQEVRDFELAAILVIDLLVLEHKLHFAGNAVSDLFPVEDSDAVVAQLDADGVGVIGLEEGERVEGGLVEHVDAAQKDQLGAVREIVQFVHVLVDGWGRRRRRRTCH